MFGFLNIYKPKNYTSFDVVAVLRKITHIKQIGHTGTLDPFAVGVLPICIGKSTKLIEYLPDDKEYIATIQLGKETNTYDLEGEITNTYPKIINEQELKNILEEFKGETEQTPPIYSALKVNGKKLYEYAREGKEIEIKPRKIFISKIDLLKFDQTEQIAQIIVGCSKGTYIRSIAYDIGKKLNCGGYLIALERTKAGMFNIDNAIKLEDIKTKNDVEKNLINPLIVTPILRYTMDNKERELVSHGMSIKLDFTKLQKTENVNKSKKDSEVVFLVYGDKINAVGMVNENKIIVKKVFEVL